MREERTDALSPHEERTHAFTCFNTLASGQEIPFGRRFVPLIDFQLPSDSRSPARYQGQQQDPAWEQTPQVRDLRAKVGARWGYGRLRPLEDSALSLQRSCRCSCASLTVRKQVSLGSWLDPSEIPPS